MICYTIINLSFLNPISILFENIKIGLNLIITLFIILMEVIKKYLNSALTKVFPYLLLLKNNLNNLRNYVIFHYIKFTDIKTLNGSSLYYRYFLMLILTKLSGLVNKAKMYVDKKIELGEIHKYNKNGTSRQIIKNTTLASVVDQNLDSNSLEFCPIIFLTLSFDGKNMQPSEFVKYFGYTKDGDNTIDDIVKLNLGHTIVNNTCEIATSFFYNKKPATEKIVLVGTDTYGPNDLVEILIATQESKFKEFDIIGVDEQTTIIEESQVTEQDTEQTYQDCNKELQEN